jgi:DNA-binding transcriptional MerR regulator
MVYTIGEMAKRLNVAASTLRYYDKEGLLPFVQRTSSGIRMFRDEDMPMMNIIECLKQTGMPIKDIKTFVDHCAVGDDSIEDRYRIIQEQRQSVLQQMQELQDNLDMLEYKEFYYRTAKEAGSCHYVNQLSKDQVPAKFRKFHNEHI